MASSLIPAHAAMLTSTRMRYGGKFVDVSHFTPEKRDAALRVLEDTANLSAAADAAGCSRTALWELRCRDAEFDAACKEALERATDRLERKVRARAEDGTERGVYYKGERVDTEIETHDNLSMFMLKAHRPEVYRPDVAVQVGVGLSVSHAVQLSDAELERIVATQARDTLNVSPPLEKLSTNRHERPELLHDTSQVMQCSATYGDKGPGSARRGGGRLATRAERDPKEEHGRASPRRKRAQPQKHISQKIKKGPKCRRAKKS